MTKKKAKKKRPVRKPAEQKPAEQKPVVEVTAPPTAGRKVVDFERKLDEQIAGGPPEPEKRGRGRPPKESQQPDLVSTVVGSDKVIKDAVCVPFDMWARSQRIKGLRLTDEEAETLVDPIRILLDHYLPEVPAIAYAWAALVITAYAITSPKLLLIEDERRIRQSKNETLRNSDQARRSASNDQGQGGPNGPGDRFPRTDEITPLKIEN